MAPPVRVEEFGYPQGADVRLCVRFRSREPYDMVRANFYDGSGERISVWGDPEPVEAMEDTWEVVLATSLPEEQAPGTYQCSDVQGQTQDGEWEFILPSIGVDIRVLDAQFYITGKAELLEVEPL